MRRARNEETPETDALISVGLENADRECVPSDSARKLERERDEAREAFDEEKKWHHRTHTELVHTQCKILDMQMGRDEIQKKYDNLATEHMLAVNKLCNERDKAIASNNDVYLKPVLDAVTKMAVELKAERDEAREALKEIEQVFIDTDNTYEGLWKIGGIVRAALEEAK